MQSLLRTAAVLAFSPALACSTLAAGPIEIHQTPVELTVAQVGERTVHLTIAPLDEQGRPRPDPDSTVLAPFESVERLRVRELADAPGGAGGPAAPSRSARGR